MDYFEIPVGDPQEVELCDNATRWSDLAHDGAKARSFRTGWNGYEYAYEDSVVLCDECYQAAKEVRWPL